MLDMRTLQAQNLRGLSPDALAAAAELMLQHIAEQNKCIQSQAQAIKCIRPANPSTANEELQAPSCPRKPSCTPCLKRFPIRATLSPARAGSTARNSRLN